MPRLYVTPLGRWSGTQADAAKATREEGSKPGSWKPVDVNTDKASLLAILNRTASAPQPPPVVERMAKPAPNGSGRFRVYFKGNFAGVLLADSQAEAEALAPSLLSVRRTLGA